MDHIERAVDIINDNGESIIIGWYKRGIINNRLLVINKKNSQNNNNDEDIHVTGNGNNYHIVELQATDHNIIYAEINLGHDLSTLKYDVNLLQMD